jgi:hypothetical protein
MARKKSSKQDDDRREGNPNLIGEAGSGRREHPRRGFRRYAGRRHRRFGERGRHAAGKRPGKRRTRQRGRIGRGGRGNPVGISSRPKQPLPAMTGTTTARLGGRSTLRPSPRETRQGFTIGAHRGHRHRGDRDGRRSRVGASIANRRRAGANDHAAPQRGCRRRDGRGVSAARDRLAALRRHRAPPPQPPWTRSAHHRSAGFRRSR